MAKTVAREPGSACNLWHVVSGSSPISVPAQVGEELTLHESLLLEGLSRYTPPSAASLTKLKGEDLKDYQRDFILQLSNVLNLDEWQSYQLFQSYLENAFRASPKQLKTLLTQSKHFPSLLALILNYYLEERLYLLKCQAYILAHWQDTHHPLQVQFAKMVTKMNENAAGPFSKQVLKEYKAACEWKAPSSTAPGSLLTTPVINSWTCANLQEQASLLELLLLYYKEFEHTCESFMEMFNLAQAEGFGQRQPNQAPVLSPDGHWRLKWIGQVWSSLLLEGLDLDSLLLDDIAVRLEQHPLLSSSSVVREITMVMTNWGDIPHHLPLMFAWAVMLFVRTSDISSRSTEWMEAQQLGLSAIRRGVMAYLDGLVGSPCFESRPSVATVIQSTVYSLLSLVLSNFSESSLGDVKLLVSVVGKSISSPALCMEFWQGFQGSDSRCRSLLKGCQQRFPHDFRPMVDLLAVLCRGEEAADQVFNYLRELPCFAESLYELKFAECRFTQSDPDESDLMEESLPGRHKQKMCESKLPHHLCKSVDIASLGHLTLPARSGGVVDHADQFVMWEFPYSAWHLFLLMMERYVHSTPSAVASADASLQSRDLNLASLVTLVTQLLKNKWSLSNDLQPVTDRVYLLLQRSVVSANPPLELITACVECITVLAEHDAHQAWLSLQQTGFLPHSTTMPTLNTTAMPSVDGRHMASGHLGLILSDVEQAQGQYPVTLASLHLLQHLMKGLCSPITGQSWPIPLDWAACLAFVVHEVFMDFSKWRYRNPDVCNKIGFCALNIFEVVLQQTKVLHQVLPESQQSHDQTKTDLEQEKSQSSTDSAFSLSQFLVRSLLYGEASLALLNLLSTDIEALDVDSGSASQRNQLMKLTKCSLSVLTLLLQAKGEEISPLEKALSVKNVAQQPSTVSAALFGEHVHLVAVITSLIHHRHDRQLPRLATCLLKQLCMSGALSLHTCLGNQAVPIRERFVRRLRAKTESVATKVAILEMLTVAVQVQPGLIELFLDLTPVDGAGGEKDFCMSRGSCLLPVLSFLEKKQNVELCSASLAFLYGLWKDRRVSALQAMTKSEGFGENLAAPLFEDLESWRESEEQYLHHMKMVTYVVRILTVELYYCETVSTHLKKPLLKLVDTRRYSYWLEQLVPVCDDTDMEDASEARSQVSPSTAKKLMETRYELLKSLQSFLMVAVTCQALPCNLGGEACTVIMENVLETLQAHISHHHTQVSVKSPLQLASLLLFLCKSCQRSLATPSGILDRLASLLAHVFATDRAVLQLAWSNLSAALLVLLRLVKKTHSPPSAAVCDMLQCYCQALHVLRETVAGKDVQALLTSVFVLCELIPWMSTYSREWRSSLEHHAVCTLLTHLLEHCLMTHEHPELVEAILSFYVVLSQLSKGAEVVLSPSLVHQLCIALVRVLNAQVADNGASAVSHRPAWDTPPPTAMNGHGSANGTSSALQAAADSNGVKNGNGLASKSSSKNVWSSVWSLAIQLVTNVLSALRHHFIQAALDFVCAHEVRIAETLHIVSAQSVVMQQLEIVRHTMALLHGLSAFRHQWQLVLRHNFHVMHNEVLRLCHRCCGLLSHPTLLSRLAEPGPDVGKCDTSQARLLLRRFSSSPPSVLRSENAGDGGRASSSLLRKATTGTASSSTAPDRASSPDNDGIGAVSKRKRGGLAASASSASAAAVTTTTAASSTSSNAVPSSTAGPSASTSSAADNMSAPPPSARGLRRTRLSFCEDDASEPEHLPQSAIKLRCFLVEIVGDCFGLIQHLSPPLSDLFLNAGLDPAACPLLLQFSCDALRRPDDEECASFGDLVACVESCLVLMPRSSSRANSPKKARRLSKEPQSPSKSSANSRADLPDRSKVMYSVESGLMVLMGQACTYLRHPDFDLEQKRAMKRELNSIVGPLVQSICRHFQYHPLSQVQEGKPKAGPDGHSDQDFLALLETFLKTTLQ